MPSFHRFVPRMIGLAVILASVVLFAPGKVSATTGPTDFLPPTKFHVPLAVQKLYIGQYVLKSIDPASRLSGGAFGIEIDADTGYLVGIAQFSGYDQNGRQSVWEASPDDHRSAWSDRCAVIWPLIRDARCEGRSPRSTQPGKIEGAVCDQHSETQQRPAAAAKWSMTAIGGNFIRSSLTVGVCLTVCVRRHTILSTSNATIDV
jgi:hypothetical protein